MNYQESYQVINDALSKVGMQNTLAILLEIIEEELENCGDMIRSDYLEVLADDLHTCLHHYKNRYN